MLIAFSTTTFSQTSGIIRTSGNSGADSLRISNDSVFLKLSGVWVFQDTLPSVVHWSKLGNNDIISTNTTGVVRADTAFYLSSSLQTGMATTTGATLQLRSNGQDILKVRTPTVSSPVLLETGVTLTGSPSYTYKSVFGVPNTFGSSAANSMNFFGFNMNPTIDQSTHGTGTIVGFRYAPTITSLNGSAHFAWHNTAGDIRFGHLSGDGTRLLSVDNDGDVNAIAYDTSAFKIENDTLKPRKKEYIAYLYQDGTDAPVATVIKDDFGDITYGYVGGGKYMAVSGGQFTVGKTKVEISNNIMFDGSDSWLFIQSQIENDSKIVIETGKVGAVLSDGVLGQIPPSSTSEPIQNIITITVYP